ncbi:MAG: hypothetical protein NkDv07_0018 [Candidatus Improbicoccus devescovinae]|nr:MAG: hypothetical protein NkDv07_0018 [Candidatus Improbicoccus devescovinae]
MTNDEIKEAFGEDVNVIRKGTSETTYYTKHEGKLKSRTEATPNNIETSEQIMQIALGRGNKVYETPLQMAIAVKGFEQWCVDKNVALSYAGLAYYLNISKETLIKYTKDKTEFTCYNLIDAFNNFYIYSTNSREKLDNYIETNFVSENGKSLPIKEKIKKGKYKIDVCSVTFANMIAPIKNLLEIVNINKAETARNPAWHIFLAKNNFGCTNQYVDQVQQQITVNNSLDEMSDDEILKAVEGRPK